MDHQRFCNNLGEIHVRYIHQLGKRYMFEWAVTILLFGMLVVLFFIYAQLRHFVSKESSEISQGHISPVFWEYDHPTNRKEHTTSKKVKALQEWEKYSEQIKTQIDRQKAKSETKGKH